jgi:hypothetical protein
MKKTGFMLNVIVLKKKIDNKRELNIKIKET